MIICDIRWKCEGPFQLWNIQKTAEDPDGPEPTDEEDMHMEHSCS